MKLFIAILIVLLPSQWEPNFENAKKIAKENHKIILLNFSGSDWCAPCILLRRDYLENEVFTKMADENLVMVNADFPRKKKNLGTPEMIQRNETLAEQYNKDGNFPLTLLLDANGKVLKKWVGKPDVSVEKWTQEIKAVCDANK
ncbi:MAG: thioredoxin family protein [Bacteroidota bacterium]